MNRSKVFLFIALFVLAIMEARAQDSLATIHIYRLGYSEPSVAKVYPLFLDDNLSNGKLNPMSVVTLRCKPGTHVFSTTSLDFFEIDMEAGRTYFIEFKKTNVTTFQQVSKLEAKKDLSQINKYVSELVKDSDVETYQLGADSIIIPASHFRGTIRFVYDQNTQLKVGYVSFKADSLLVVLEDYRRQPNEESRSRVFLGDDQFQFFIRGKIKNGMEVRNTEGLVVASISFKGDQKYDLTLANGTVYDWRDLSKSSWWYSLNGEPVLKCTEDPSARHATFVLEWSKPVNDPILLLACLYVCNQRIASGDIKGAVAVSLLRVLIR